MLKKGDEVVTIGGMFGTVTRIGDDWVELEVAKRTRVRYLKRAISQITTVEEEEEDEYIEAEAEEDDEQAQLTEGDEEEVDDEADEAEVEDETAPEEPEAPEAAEGVTRRHRREAARARALQVPAGLVACRDFMPAARTAF